MHHHDYRQTVTSAATNYETTGFVSSPSFYPSGATGHRFRIGRTFFRLKAPQASPGGVSAKNWAIPRQPSDCSPSHAVNGGGAAIPCNPGELHWSGSAEDDTARECHGAGAGSLCPTRADGSLIFTKVTGCYRSANSGTWGAAMNLYLRTFPDRDVPNLDNWPGTRRRVKRGSSHGHSDPPNSEIASNQYALP